GIRRPRRLARELGQKHVLRRDQRIVVLGLGSGDEAADRQTVDGGDRRRVAWIRRAVEREGAEIDRAIRIAAGGRFDGAGREGYQGDGHRTVERGVLVDQRNQRRLLQIETRLEAVRRRVCILGVVIHAARDVGDQYDILDAALRRALFVVEGF